MWLVFTIALGVYAALWLRAYLARDLEDRGYLSPDEAEQEISQLAADHPAIAELEEIGKSGEGEPIRALRLRAGNGGARARLLVTAHIHAVEYIGSAVARRMARDLCQGFGRDAAITSLLERAEVWIVPLANPDGARRVWRRGGWSGLGASRFTSGAVDPNRNFPTAFRSVGRAMSGGRAWNSARDRAGSAYYRGPHPLSEPECLALARLARRERFCGAINFHSFGAVVYLPAVPGDHAAADALAVFQGEFQSRQRMRRYRPVPERSVAIAGQLDAFLLEAFGTPSVTVEVGRPSWHVLQPSRLGCAFWIANPASPERWIENDAPAAIHALTALLARTGGEPCEPIAPELVQAVDALD